MHLPQLASVCMLGISARQAGLETMDIAGRETKACSRFRRPGLAAASVPMPLCQEQPPSAYATAAAPNPHPIKPSSSLSRHTYVVPYRHQRGRTGGGALSGADRQRLRTAWPKSSHRLIAVGTTCRPAFGPSQENSSGSTVGQISLKVSSSVDALEPRADPHYEYSLLWAPTTGLCSKQNWTH